MKEALHIIVDLSGSMSEMGKIHLQRNLCRCAAQLKFIDPQKYSGSDIRFFRWAQNVSEIALQSDGDIPFLNAEGSSKLCVLSDFISQYLNDTSSSMVLILSDGHFLNSDIVNFRTMLGSFTDLIIRTVAVGADADLLKLKKIATNNTVHLSENITSAIDSTLFGFDEPLTAPASTVQILQSESIEPEEPEDDWDA